MPRISPTAPVPAPRDPPPFSGPQTGLTYADRLQLIYNRLERFYLEEPRRRPEIAARNHGLNGSIDPMAAQLAIAINHLGAALKLARGREHEATAVAAAIAEGRKVQSYRPTEIGFSRRLLDTVG